MLIADSASTRISSEGTAVGAQIDGYGCFKAAALRCAAPMVLPCTVAQQDAGNGSLACLGAVS
jgi:hypothetical protein